MTKLEKEIDWLNSLLNDYVTQDNNDIYDRLTNIAKCKYLKGDGIADYQENFFVNFITNGEQMNNYENLYSSKLHNKLIKIRRKYDPNFLLNIKID